MKWFNNSNLIPIAAILLTAQTLLADQVPHITKMNDCTVSLPQEARFIAVDKTNAPKAWCLVENTANNQRTLRLDLLINRPREKPELQSQTLRLAAKEAQQVSLPSAWFDQYGIYRLEFRLVEGEDASPWANDILAVYPRNPQPELGESVMPIGFATGAALCTPRLLELAASLGFEYYRYNAVWQHVQPQEGTWNWERIDNYLDLVKRYNFQWHVTTTGCPSWATEQRFDPPPLDAWREWISALATRHSESMQFWEVWNEPNISFFNGSVEEYTQLQRVAHDAIKEASPSTVVTSGGYAGMNHHKSKPGAFEAAFLEHPRAYDWFAYHMHDAFPQFYSDLHHQLAAIQQRTGKTDVPIVFTETGYDTRHGQRFQAETLLKKMTYAAAIGAKSYTWYNLMDRAGGNESNRAGKTFGLISNPTDTGDFASIEDELRPKESFIAAATAIPQLRRLPPLQVWSESDGLFAFLFGRPNDQLLVTWRENPQIPEAIWAVRSEATHITQRDLFGNTTEIPQIDGVALIPLGVPQYFDFEGSEAPPRLLGPLITLPHTISANAEGVAAVELKLHNPLDRAIMVNAAVGEIGEELLPQADSREIAAGETLIFPMSFDVGEGALGKIVNVEAQFTFLDTPWAPRLNIPIVYNVIRAGQNTKVILNSLNQVTNKQDYDPHTLHLLWGSPADLSVQANVLSDPSSDLIKITCKVTDNHHYPASSEESLLDGDALEIGWTGADGASGHLAIAGDVGTSPRNEFHLNGELIHKSPIRSIQITRKDTTTTWELALDTRHMGLCEKDFNDGLRFNFAVHDNDSEGPKSWMSPVPGLGGKTHFSSDSFHILQIGMKQ
ncbi:hypothetical protein [Cerasicoccus arenae]|uniref:Xylan 1,4-beta-xylosidase n=1 Tax=Cerasicoccus arenae TaxID=424488 RepID=A0A8J3DI33_9BACT|nr:hypothetical protein [Cerasicoccus arenae]MBK1859249.1 hypothetical protein [Cerasicoccus arenae]GHC01718.1 hypothetical protein GCM10007047_17880 [Cerasicoccus arenae]